MNKIERYGRKGDREAILAEMPIIGQRQILQPLNNFFVQHMSDQIQVTYVIEGAIDFTLDGCVHNVKKGEVIINKPGQIFGALNETFPPSKSAFFKINLDSNLTGWNTSELEIMKNGLEGIIAPHLTPDIRFIEVFKNIIDEHRNPGSLSSIKCRALFQQLLVMILEAHETFLKNADFKVKTAEDMLSQINTFVGENLGRKIYSNEMADLVGLSNSHFRYLFTLIFRSTPSEYLLRRRIEKAKDLLTTSKSITSIAYELAFSSSQYFSNAFKKLTGMRPKEYRRATQNMSAENKTILGDQESSEFMDSFYS